jgi:hypothetical protein
MKSAGDEHHLIVAQFANLIRSVVLRVFRHGVISLSLSLAYSRKV